jgi:spore maturation protein CgeB
MPGRPPLVGWVGDMPVAADRLVAGLFDALAYTDTGMLARHQALGFRPPAHYLPHAASSRLDLGVPDAGSRRMRLAFVANPTAHRRAVIGGLREPVALFGPAWTAFPRVAHAIEARRVGVEELAAIYRGHLGVLNIHHEDNVVHGLNQRHFDPCLAGTPVLTDPQDDLARCFEPNREVLVFDGVEGLNALHARVLREPGWALAVGAAARRRVLADHTYGHRLAVLAGMAG